MRVSATVNMEETAHPTAKAREAHQHTKDDTTATLRRCNVPCDHCIRDPTDTEAALWCGAPCAKYGSCDGPHDCGDHGGRCNYSDIQKNPLDQDTGHAQAERHTELQEEARIESQNRALLEAELDQKIRNGIQEAEELGRWGDTEDPASRSEVTDIEERSHTANEDFVDPDAETVTPDPDIVNNIVVRQAQDPLQGAETDQGSSK